MTERTPLPHLDYAPIARFEGRATQGVLSRRLVAFCVDFVMVGALVVLFGFAIAVFGLVTLGLGWMLYAILVPGVWVLYTATTIGGRNQATIGMRVTGLRVARASSAARVDGLTAIVHGLLFWLATSTLLLWVLDVVIGLARADRRLGHDLVVDVVVLRSDVAA